MILKHHAYYAHLLRQVPYGVVRRLTHKRCLGYEKMAPFLTGKCIGLEIGGPSRIFCGDHLIPVYNICSKVDLCNFAVDTIWSKLAEEQMLGSHAGRRFVAEGGNLSSVPSEAYEFVLASHVLEHSANPLQMLRECKRVLRPGGVIVIVLPDKFGSFDHQRSFTSFQHLLSDFEKNTSEDDLTHLHEILSLHDLRLDPLAGSLDEFKQRCLQNPAIRAIHHHVFSPETLICMLDYLRMRILNIAVERPFHIIGMAEKCTPDVYEDCCADNRSLLGPAAVWRTGDPFRKHRQVERNLQVDYMAAALSCDKGGNA